MRSGTIADMTNDKFRDLCDQVLVPKLGDLLHRQLAGMHEELEMVSRELVRIGDSLDRLISLLSRSIPHEDQ